MRASPGFMALAAPVPAVPTMTAIPPTPDPDDASARGPALTLAVLLGAALVGVVVLAPAVSSMPSVAVTNTTTTAGDINVTDDNGTIDQIDASTNITAEWADADPAYVGVCVFVQNESGEWQRVATQYEAVDGANASTWNGTITTALYTSNEALNTANTSQFSAPDGETVSTDTGVRYVVGLYDELDGDPIVTDSHTIGFTVTVTNPEDPDPSVTATVDPTLTAHTGCEGADPEAGRAVPCDTAAAES